MNSPMNENVASTKASCMNNFITGRKVQLTTKLSLRPVNVLLKIQGTVIYRVEITRVEITPGSNELTNERERGLHEGELHE